MEKYAKLLEMIGYHRLVTGGDRLQLKPVTTSSKLQKTSLHQFRAVAVAVMSILGNKELVRLSVALFGGKKPDWTRPENTNIDNTLGLDPTCASSSGCVFSLIADWPRLGWSSMNAKTISQSCKVRLLCLHQPEALWRLQHEAGPWLICPYDTAYWCMEQAFCMVCRHIWEPWPSFFIAVGFYHPEKFRATHGQLLSGRPGQIWCSLYPSHNE